MVKVVKSVLLQSLDFMLTSILYKEQVVHILFVLKSQTIYSLDNVYASKYNQANQNNEIIFIFRPVITSLTILHVLFFSFLN